MNVGWYGLTSLLLQTMPKSFLSFLPAFVPFRAHFIEGIFSGEKLKKYDRPELPTLNPQTRWQINTRNGVRVSYIMCMYQYQIKLLKSCCIQWGAWMGPCCPQTQTSFKNCTLCNSCTTFNELYICFELACQFLILLLLPLILLQVLNIQNASIVVSDIPASNGIIHILSQVCWYMWYWEMLQW